MSAPLCNPHHAEPPPRFPVMQVEQYLRLFVLSVSALALGSESVKGSGSVKGLVSALRSENLQFLLVGVSRYSPYLGFDSPRYWVLCRVIHAVKR